MRTLTVESKETIKGTNVNITFDDSMASEADLMGSMHRFDTEKVTTEIVKMFLDKMDDQDPYIGAHMHDRVHDIIESHLADERSKAHCRCKKSQED